MWACFCVFYVPVCSLVRVYVCYVGVRACVSPVCVRRPRLVALGDQEGERVYAEILAAEAGFDKP